jgi:anti-sigma factor RsiW
VTSEPAHLSCQEFVELVTDYFEDAMPRDERERFDAHLAVCQPCTRYLEQMEQTIRTVGQLSADDLGSEAESVLLEAFRDWKSP